MSHSGRNIAKVPLSIEQDQQRHARDRMSRSRYKNVSLLSENLRFRGFVTSEWEWEFLRRSRYARDERKNEYKKYTTACDESHFLRRHSSQERT